MKSALFAALTPALSSALVLCALAGDAQAHDSWFQPLPAKGGEQTLLLGTGTQFPKYESAIDGVYLRQHGCWGATGALPLSALRLTDTALVTSTALKAGSCWTQIAPFEIDLPADKIDLYISEIRPPQAMLDAWAALHARGLPWKERYTKHARIVLPGADAAAATQPSGMGMDVLLDSAGATPQAGQALGFQVLRDGQPLPDFAVELRSDRSRFGFWRKTDAEGRLRFVPPFAGQWVLRGVDLRLSETVPDSFDSRFVTLAFSVAALKN